MLATSRVPRVSLALLSTIHAIVLGACAYLLPWPSFSVFTFLAAATALGHLATAGLAAVGSDKRAVAWRLTSLLSIGLFGYATYALIGSGLYVNHLYEGVGAAILAAAIGAWCVGILFLVPLSAWGIAATGGLLRRKKIAGAVGGGTAIVAGVVVLAFAAALEASQARGKRLVAVETPILDDDVAIALARLPPGNPPSATAPSLFVDAPVPCPSAIDAPGIVSVFVTFVEGDGKAAAPMLACLQAWSLESALADATAFLQARQSFGDAMLDVAVSARELPDAGPLLGPIVLRPGIEGVCEGGSCLMPWQLFGLDAFTEAANVSALQAEIGVTPEALRKHLGSGGKGYRGLVAVTTRTYLVKGGAERTVIPLRHLRSGPRPLDPQTTEGAVRDAVAFIGSSQIKDGRFFYTVQPFTGATSFENFSVPRQAGTTLALCDASAYGPKAKEAASKSLGYLSGLIQTNGDFGGVIYPKKKTGVNAPLGSTALSLVAMLSCRAVVGKIYDEAIVRLAKTLLVMQRKNGSFMPAWNPANGEAVEGRDALYAGGQAVFALVLWEGPEGEGLERPPGLGDAIDRAMNYYSGPYWDIPLRDFFYLEENWHCLAARAALGHHRRPKYERFCLDYMTMKKRFIQSPSSGVDEDHVGAYAFGHVFPPHHAAAAGFAEALAASIDIKRARRESTAHDEQVLRWTLSYLLRFQWRDDNCALCTRKLRVTGGWSENAASPIVRIDFVQHALSGVLHGSQSLELLDR